MRWDLHGIGISGSTNDPELCRRWQTAFASLDDWPGRADLSVSLEVTATIPAPPVGEPHFRQGDLLKYYTNGGNVIAHFPRYGQLQLDLAQGTSQGRVVEAALESYGVLEDLIAIALSPHLRRRGRFLLHAFAAAYDNRAVLLVGGVGAGKTTTGMALLEAGWRLLSNDSPIVADNGQILSYPGLLAAYPDSMRRFAETKSLIHAQPEGRKLVVAAERVWPGVWVRQATPAGIFFPQIEPGGDHRLQPLTPPETLRRLLPHAVEQWDREMIPAHLGVLSRLAEMAPGYVLHLGPEVSAIPYVLAERVAS